MLFGAAVVVFALGFHVILADEPKCLSRFDYDEKMLLKLLRIEDKLEHFEQVIQDLKSVELENLKQTDQQLQMEMNVFQEKIKTTAEHSHKTTTLLTNCQDNISMVNASVGLLQMQIIEERGRVVFNEEVFNEGKAFTPATGEFLAPLSGLYYFSFNLLASSSNTHMYCHFYKNRDDYIVYTYADGTSSSYDSGSMSAFITLKKGEIFNVGSCAGTPSVSFIAGTALTGALIKVDYV
ncbi:C1QT7-like protein [Mya arenaria]|uniref:C1QT7-like protein n=1 Tax=Mya arenaria TaxID=6604 RepID=A0ABY7EQM0_MYAAR|nr:C1QT7-like protein [Mya arenaria]